MCWDISLRTDIELVKQSYPKIRDERKRIDYDYTYFENVQAITFPNYPILYRDKESGDLGLVEMEWGVLPSYIKDAKLQTDRRRNMVNVRSERILEDKKSYWYRLRNQRCLIPVSGTYEHRKINGWKKKVPYFIAEKGRDLFYLPGLYQWHETIDVDGVVEKVGSFGMLTRAANNVMANIHNDGPNKHRMPLFLPNDLEELWLSDISDEEMMPILNFEIAEKDLSYHPVYTLRGYPNRPDDGHRYDTFDWDGLPPLGTDKPIENTLF